jgi:rhodanese-related sulfurtransferase
VGVSEAVQMVNRSQGVFVDVRPAEKFQAGTIAQARNLPAAELQAKAAGLPKNKPLIVFCDQGRASVAAAAALRKQGLEAVSLEGGLAAWVKAGMPTSKKQ